MFTLQSRTLANSYTRTHARMFHVIQQPTRPPFFGTSQPPTQQTTDRMILLNILRLGLCSIAPGCTLWLYSVAVLCGCTLWLYSMAVLCGFTLWLYSVAILCGCTLCLYSVDELCGVLCGCTLCTFLLGSKVLDGKF